MPKINLSNLSLKDFPTQENEEFEFKSSLTQTKELKKKIKHATSAFANSGGGVFVCGIDDNGNDDGGIEISINQQSLEDWLNQIVNEISPLFSREIRLYDACQARGYLEPDKVVAAISIHPSDLGPFQAEDYRYYIRAGAHTVPAKHYLVESLWARRNFQKPKLVHITRFKASDPDIIQIGVISATNAPALNVEITISPIINNFLNKGIFPFIVPMIDSNNPFYFDFTVYRLLKETLSEDIEISVTYSDLLGNNYSYKNEHPLGRSLGNTLTVKQKRTNPWQSRISTDSV